MRVSHFNPIHIGSIEIVCLCIINEGGMRIKVLSKRREISLYESSQCKHYRRIEN